MSLHSETKEPDYHNGRFTPLAFQFQYSKEAYANNLPFFNNLNTLEENKMNSFLEFIDETELKSKRQPEEIKDITEAVNEVVDSFAQHLGKVDPILAVSQKYAVGSMAEGTKIKEPDEFDFILVLKELNTDTISLETICNKDIFIECEEECWMNSRHYSVPMPVIQKCTSDIEYQHVHLPLTNLAFSNRNKKFPGKWKRLGYACCWKNYFLQCLYRDSDCLLRFLDLKVTKSTGTIKNIHQDISKIKASNGPAMTLDLLWEPKTGNKLEISVDLVLAIQMKGIEKVIDSEKRPCQIYNDILLETNQFFLIPILSADMDVCFKVSVTTTEQRIMSNLSKAHILCYRILKYIFQKPQCPPLLINSYFLKTFLLRHVALCNSQENPAQCLMNILKILSVAINESKTVYNNIITLENLFIPGLVITGLTHDEPDDLGIYLTATAEQLFKAAKSEHNEETENLKGLKHVMEKIDDEISQQQSQFALCGARISLMSLIKDIAAGPGEPIDKFQKIKSLASSCSFLLHEDFLKEFSSEFEKLYGETETVLFN